jgi:hypothetical protein
MRSPDSSEAEPQTQRIDPATGDVPYPRREADEMPDSVTPIPGIDEPLTVVMQQVISTREQKPSRGITGSRRVQADQVTQVLGEDPLREKATLRFETESGAVTARLAAEKESAHVIGFPFGDSDGYESWATCAWYVHSTGGYVDVFYIVEAFESTPRPKK